MLRNINDKERKGDLEYYYLTFNAKIHLAFNNKLYTIYLFTIDVKKYMLKISK